MVNDKLLRVKELLKEEKAIEAKVIFDDIAPEDTVMYLMVKGLIEQKFQRWGGAINSFQKVLAIEPENMEAKNQIQMIQSILKFWNPETFNP